MARRLLIVDDEPDLAELIKFRLEKAGYAINIAHNGKEGLALALKQLPDMIITDVLMPEMDGYEFYKELKKKKETEDIPVIILTARGGMEDSFKGLGVDDFMAKPFNSEELLKKIERLFKIIEAKERGMSKVFIIGTSEEVVEKMSSQIKALKGDPDSTVFGSEVVAKAIEFNPDIIMLEVFSIGLTSPELIKMLRCLSQFRKTPILIYSYLSAKDIGNKYTSIKLNFIGETREACLEAGGTEYVGNYSEPLFNDLMKKYIA